MPTLDIGSLNRSIRNDPDRVPDALSGLANARVYDERGQTPLNTAIEAGNRPVFDIVVQLDDAPNFVPPIDPDLKRRVRNVTRDHHTDTVTELETFITKIIDDKRLHWARSPLLQACRYGDRGAIEQLLAHGAKPNATDLLQYSALELCDDAGGHELVDHLLAACRSNRKKPLVKAGLLEAIAHDTTRYEALLRDGAPAAEAKRLVFNLACAVLDIERVSELLAGGYNVNRSGFHGRGPLGEAATSHLAWLLKRPESRQVAPALHRVLDRNDTFMFSGKDLTALVTELEQLDEDALADYFFGEEGEEPETADGAVIEIEAPGGVNPKMHSAEQVSQRLRLMDLLIAHGYDVTSMKRHQREDLLNDVISGNEPRLLQKLVDLGVAFERDDDAIVWAIQMRCFDMVEPLEELGFRSPQVEPHWAKAHEEFSRWRESPGSDIRE